MISSILSKASGVPGLSSPINLTDSILLIQSVTSSGNSSMPSAYAKSLKSVSVKPDFQFLFKISQISVNEVLPSNFFISFLIKLSGKSSLIVFNSS
jgi:hypothetical protein